MQPARFLVERAQALRGLLPGQRKQRFHLLLRDSRLNVPPDVVEAVQHARQVLRIEFSCLHQHFFAYSHLTEIVQQRGVAQFFHLFAGKPQIPIRAAQHAVHGRALAGSRTRGHGVRGHAVAAVAASGGAAASADGASHP